jgi:hypothetical protein
VLHAGNSSPPFSVQLDPLYGDLCFGNFSMSKELFVKDADILHSKEHLKHRRARKIPSCVFLMMSVLNSVKDLHHLPSNLGKPQPERPYLLPDF